MCWDVAVCGDGLPRSRVRHWSLGGKHDALAQLWDGVWGKALPLLSCWMVCASACSDDLMAICTPGINDMPCLVGCPFPSVCWKGRTLVTNERGCPALFGKGWGCDGYGWFLCSPTDGMTFGTGEWVSRACLRLCSISYPLLGNRVVSNP